MNGPPGIFDSWTIHSSEECESPGATRGFRFQETAPHEAAPATRHDGTLFNAQRFTPVGGFGSMSDARELRSKAERCLRLAAQITDDKVAASLKTLAAEYLDRAAEIEGTRPPPPADAPQQAAQQQQQPQPKKDDDA
jgi:hypothetical protein